MQFKKYYAFACIFILASCGRGNDSKNDSSDDVNQPTEKSAILSLSENVKFVSLPAFNQRDSSSWGPVLKDVINHEAPGDSNVYDDRVTVAHETTHGINAHIRNYMNTTKQPMVNGFYVLQNKAVLFVEPRMGKSQIASFVPTSLRASRYTPYLLQANDWEPHPLYIFDEWISYTNGGQAGYDLVKVNKWGNTWRDAMMGPLEFTIYALATVQAISVYDPTYFTREPNFLPFVAWNIERVFSYYHEGSKFTQFKFAEQDNFLVSFRTSSEAAVLRNFAAKTFGEAWAKEVLGI